MYDSHFHDANFYQILLYVLSYPGIQSRCKPPWRWHADKRFGIFYPLDLMRHSSKSHQQRIYNGYNLEDTLLNKAVVTLTYHSRSLILHENKQPNGPAYTREIRVLPLNNAPSQLDSEGENGSRVEDFED